MSVNSSSSSSNASFPPPASFLSPYSQIFQCHNSKDGTFNITAFFIVSTVLILPLCALVFYLGLQRWRRRRPGAVTSYSDAFTYHMVAMELVNILGCTLICCGVHADVQLLVIAGIFVIFINLFGQMYFHLLTCVERYLAVVHPVTYRNLWKQNAVRVRNGASGCGWLLSVAAASLLFLEDKAAMSITMCCVMAVVLIAFSFFSASVLCVLKRPGPGEGGGARQRVDQSKLRAFHTIVAVLGALLVKFGGLLIALAFNVSMQLLSRNICAVQLTLIWFSVPSSLVLPLLFLHRAGKLVCCTNSSEPEIDRVEVSHYSQFHNMQNKSILHSAADTCSTPRSTSASWSCGPDFSPEPSPKRRSHLHHQVSHSQPARGFHTGVYLQELNLYVFNLLTI
ncbi:uncharacterized protein V6R79_020303 [Siganus canaliculatus]